MRFLCHFLLISSYNVLFVFVRVCFVGAWLLPVLSDCLTRFFHLIRGVLTADSRPAAISQIGQAAQKQCVLVFGGLEEGMTCCIHPLASSSVVNQLDPVDKTGQDFPDTLLAMCFNT